MLGQHGPMRTVLYYGAVVAASVLATFAGSLVTADFEGAAPGQRVAARVGAAVLVYGPLLLWSVVLDGRRGQLWWGAGTITASVVASGTLVWSCSHSSSPRTIVLAVLVILIGAALIGVAIPIGAGIRRWTTRHPSAEWTPIVAGLEGIPRRVRLVAGTFLIATVVGGISSAAFADTGRREGPWATVLSTGGLACIAAAVVAAFAGLGFVEVLRDVTAGDPIARRRVNGVVFRRRTTPLDLDETRMAVDYAAASVVMQRFQSGHAMLLVLGAGAGLMRDFLRGDNGGFDDVLVGSYLVILVVLVPLTVARLRRASQYVAAHAEFLGPTG
jgi:hypothetical protein